MTLAPVVEQLAQDYAGKIKIVAVDAHNNYETASAYNITGLPTLVMFKDGKEVGRIVGAQPRENIVNEIESKIGA